jgi:hypothetical protein
MGRRPLIRPWTDDDDQKLLRYLEQGKDRRVIAALLRRPSQSIAGRIATMKKVKTDGRK